MVYWAFTVFIYANGNFFNLISFIQSFSLRITYTSLK